MNELYQSLQKSEDELREFQQEHREILLQNPIFPWWEGSLTSDKILRKIDHLKRTTEVLDKLHDLQKEVEMVEREIKNEERSYRAAHIG